MKCLIHIWHPPEKMSKILKFRNFHISGHPQSRKIWNLVKLTEDFPQGFGNRAQIENVPPPSRVGGRGPGWGPRANRGRRVIRNQLILTHALTPSPYSYFIISPLLRHFIIKTFWRKEEGTVSCEGDGPGGVNKKSADFDQFIYPWPP